MQGSTEVLLGGQPIPLQYVSPSTIYAQIPYLGVPINTTQQLVVKRGERLSAPETVVIAPQFAILLPNSVTRAGEEYSLRAFGLGEVEPRLSDDGTPSAGRAFQTKHPVKVLYRGHGETEWKTAITLWSCLSYDRAGEYEVRFSAPGLDETKAEFQLLTGDGATKGAVMPMIVSH